MTIHPTVEDQELALAAWECAKGPRGVVHPIQAIRLLRDECGWTLRRAVLTLSALNLMEKPPGIE